MIVAAAAAVAVVVVVIVAVAVVVIAATMTLTQRTGSERPSRKLNPPPRTTAIMKSVQARMKLSTRATARVLVCDDRVYCFASCNKSMNAIGSQLMHVTGLLKHSLGAIVVTAR